MGNCNRQGVPALLHPLHALEISNGKTKTRVNPQLHHAILEEPKPTLKLLYSIEAYPTDDHMHTSVGPAHTKGGQKPN